MPNILEEPPGYDDVVAEVQSVEPLTSIGMHFPNCTGCMDADSWGHPSPWTRNFDFKLHIRANMASAAANDDPNATFNYAKLSNDIDRSLKDSTQNPAAAPDCFSRPYHLTAWAWHARLANYITRHCPRGRDATMESTFPIARAGADAKVTYCSTIKWLGEQFSAPNDYYHDATMSITNMRALVGFGHKARDREMRQVVLISLKLRLSLPTKIREVNRLMPGGAHNLTEAIINQLSAYPHFQTLNKLAVVVRDTIGEELARYAADSQPPPSTGELYQENRVLPHPFRIDVPAQLIWLKVEAPNHLDTSNVSMEIDFQPSNTEEAGTSLPLTPMKLQPVAADIHPQAKTGEGSRSSVLRRATLTVSSWWNRG